MNFNRILLWVILSLFTAHALAQALDFTGWVKSSALTALVKLKGEDRLFPARVEGRLEGTAIEYRAQFVPFPENMDFFQSRWGMTGKWYQHYSGQYINAGFRELSHTTFADQSGIELHQATWILVSENDVAPGKEGTVL